MKRSDLLKLILGFALFVGGLAIVASLFRPQLEGVGTWFISNFGAAGMGIGSFLADGLHFPVPPQFYLVAAVAGGGSQPVAFFSVLIGSVFGGLLAFQLGRSASGTRFLARRFQSYRSVIANLFEKHGYWGLAIAGILPLSYCLIAGAAGLVRLPYRAYGVLAVMRIPRLLFSFWLVLLALRAGH